MKDYPHEVFHVGKIGSALTKNLDTFATAKTKYFYRKIIRTRNTLLYTTWEREIEIEFEGKRHIWAPSRTGIKDDTFHTFDSRNNLKKKCVRKMIFRTVKVRVEGRIVTFNPYFVCDGHWVTVRPVWSHVTRKINITFLSINNLKSKLKLGLRHVMKNEIILLNNPSSHVDVVDTKN